MKKTLLAVMLVIPILANAQTFKIDENFTRTTSVEPAYLIDTVCLSDYNQSQLYSNVLAYLHSLQGIVINTDNKVPSEISFSGRDNTKILNHSKSKKGTLEQIDLFYKGTFYVKDQKFKIVLSSLQYQPSNFTSASILSNTIDYTDIKKVVNIEDKSNERGIAAQELAMYLIKDMAKKTNLKPASDF